MKTIKHLFTALLLLCTTVVTAHDFEVDGIYYYILSEDDKTVEVTYRGNNYDSYSNEYAGNVSIPKCVTYNGTTYSVTSIGISSLRGCNGLTSITIPNSVTSIGSYAFEDCTSLKELRIEDGEGALSLGNNLIGYSDLYYSKTGEGLFYDCPLEILYLGRNLSYKTGNDYGYSPFYGIKTLANVTIGNSVTSIGSYAFRSCSGLTSIEIPNSITNIGSSAFSGCSGLTSVVIPNSVTSIGERAFANCSGLLDVYCLAKNAPSLDVTAFEGSYPEYMDLYVYPEALSKYQSTEPWSTFGNIIPFAFNLTVSAAGYATLYLDYAVEIPAGVEVYIAKAVEGEYLKMQLVDGVIPANTAVIVKADAGTYTFNGAVNTVPAIEDNLFKGSVEDKMVKVASDEAAYVLSMVDGEVGMYRAELTDGAFLNNANKAYLLLGSNRLGIYDKEFDTSTGGQLSNGYRFDFSGITGISEVKGQSGEVKGIYDLQGRKVENPTNGIYIINGKKVLVK